MFPNSFFLSPYLQGTHVLLTQQKGSTSIHTSHTHTKYKRLTTIIIGYMIHI